VAHVLGRLIERAVYGRRRHDLLDRLAAASAHLRLVAPPEVDAYMIKVEVLAEEHRPGDRKWIKRWRELRAEMRQGFREALHEHG
jgi:hypothetical protein